MKGGGNIGNINRLIFFNFKKIKTMKLSKSLALRAQEVLLDGQWIAGTNVHHEIKIINWENADQSLMGLNSIAALTYHLTYYLSGLNVVMQGGELTISDQFSFNFPDINTEQNWFKLIQTFLIEAQLFVNLVEALDDEKLNQPFVDQKYGSWLRNIEGVIEHSYYHLGQMVLINKLIQQN